MRQARPQRSDGYTTASGTRQAQIAVLRGHDGPAESDAFDRGHGTTAYCADLQQAGTHGFAVDVNLCARPALCPLSDLGNAIRLAALTTSSLWRQHG